MFDYDGIIFDMDGVIFDSESLGLRCWEDIGARYGLKNVRETAKLCIGRSTPDTMAIFEKAYGHLVSIEALYTESKDHMHELIRNEGLPLKPGAGELLQWLSEQGRPIGLCSSTRSTVVRSQLSDAGLLRYFDDVVGGEMVEHSKPLPDIYLMSNKHLGTDPSRTIAVEDSRNGIISASDAGLIPVLVPDLIEPDEEMLSRAAMKFDSLLELLEYLKSK